VGSLYKKAPISRARKTSRRMYTQEGMAVAEIEGDKFLFMFSKFWLRLLCLELVSKR